MWKEITIAAYVYVFIVKKLKEHVNTSKFNCQFKNRRTLLALYRSPECRSSQVYTFKTWRIKGKFDSRFRQNILKFLHFILGNMSMLNHIPSTWNSSLTMYWTGRKCLKYAKLIKTIILTKIQNATSSVLSRFSFIWPSDLFLFTRYDPYSNMD